MARKTRDLVEDPNAHPGVETARSMSDAANSEDTLGGYAAVNAVTDAPEESAIAQLAYEIYRQREVSGTPGSAESDWVEAESRLRTSERGPDGKK
jgi:hypothetical protein